MAFILWWNLEDVTNPMSKWKHKNPETTLYLHTIYIYIYIYI